MHDPPSSDAPDDATRPVATANLDPQRYSLLVLAGDAVSAHELVAGTSVTIGRAPGSDVCVADGSISRRHAVLHVGGDGALSLEDAGSHNGVRLRHRRVPAATTVPLATGELFQLGSVVFVVQQGLANFAPSTPALAPAPRTEATFATGPAAEHARRAGIVVRDAAMQRVYRLLERVADSDLSVLLLGETGVGKEVLAEAVHQLSPRAAGPFVRLNCAALSPTLLESELFGHEKGAFTGAVATRPGLLETAAGGTVFLDETGEMPLPLQAKLLRVIEERQVLRVGARTPRLIDVRFVSATHRDLRAEIDRGTFRQDLFFRLNGFSVVIPPLRERPGEIEDLARLFVHRVATQRGRPVPTLAPATVTLLQRYAWPGNIRELRNALEQAAVLAEGSVIGPDLLPDELRANAPRIEPAPGGPLRNEMAALERARILDALEKCSGNQTRAAQMLGMRRATLVARIEEYGVPRPRKGHGNG